MIARSLFQRVVPFAVLACMAAAQLPAAEDPRAGPTAATLRANELAGAGKPWDDRQDFDNATRNWIARPEGSDIRNSTGTIVWRFKDHAAMLQSPRPDTVNPILWRQAQLNAAAGLFKVVDRVYQVRGYDLANLTIVEGDSGVILIDPLLSVETANAALALYRKSRGDRPVKAVIYTHSHMDHFGGVKGVVDEADVYAGKVPVLAPRNFLREAIIENVTAGNAMQRRTMYFSGIFLPKDDKGSLDAGLGPAVSSGTYSFIAPTDEIQDERATRVIDGVTLEFHQASNTEAPSEMIIWLPQFSVLNMAETAVHTAHNVLTPRGAQARDADAWSNVLDMALADYAPRAEALVGQHHWPTWGREAISHHLGNQRDFYRYVRDQTLRMANQGANMGEIAEALALPPGLDSDWAVQDNYGTLANNGKAVFQYYLGWYDGNPATLRPLPRADGAKKYVQYMGGAANILARAQRDFDAGEYRWVAEVLNQVLFAEPGNASARTLQARTFEQLGYQQVSSVWRNIYLTAAQELRSGVPAVSAGARFAPYLRDMPAEMLLDFAGIALSSDRASGQQLKINFNVRDTAQVFSLTIANSTSNRRTGGLDTPDASIDLTKRALAMLVFKQASLESLVASGEVRIMSGAAAFTRWLAMLEEFRPDFPLVTG